MRDHALFRGDFELLKPWQYFQNSSKNPMPIKALTSEGVSLGRIDTSLWNYDPMG